MEEHNLFVFPGDFGLPSLDRECLLTLAYCRFSGIPNLKVHHCTNLYLSKVPALRTAHKTIYGSADIIEYFERKNYGSSADASQQQKLDLWSYKTLIMKKLEPCLQFFWWYDMENYNGFLSGWYAKRLPFPTNFFIPNKMRKDAVAKLEAQFSNKVIESESKDKHIENEVVNDARHCINLLIEKLSTQKYFVGDKPSLFDAFVFSYLALLYKVPCKKCTIQNYISLSDPLKDYLERVLKSYFGSEQATTINIESSGGDDSFSSIKWRDVLFSGMFASVLMIYYAVSNGILSISNESDAYDAEEEQEEELDEHES